MVNAELNKWPVCVELNIHVAGSLIPKQMVYCYLIVVEKYLLYEKMQSCRNSTNNIDLPTFFFAAPLFLFFPSSFYFLSILYFLKKRCKTF